MAGTLASLFCARCVWGLGGGLRNRRDQKNEWPNYLPTRVGRLALARGATANRVCTVFGRLIHAHTPPAAKSFVIAGAALLLLFVGIHNAWDAVTYITIDQGTPTEIEEAPEELQPEQPREVEPEDSTPDRG